MNEEVNKAPKSKIFNWTDEETALLLKVVLDYKVGKIQRGTDWETVKQKYEDVKELFLLAYPKEQTEEFPNASKKEEFTKERVTAKLKKMKNGFRKAIDSGRKSGGGRVVYALYDECHAIWAGSPATEAVAEGIETAVINEVLETSSDKECTGTPIPELAQLTDMPLTPASLVQITEEGEGSIFLTSAIE